MTRPGRPSTADQKHQGLARTDDGESSRDALRPVWVTSNRLMDSSTGLSRTGSRHHLDADTTSSTAAAIGSSRLAGQRPIALPRVSLVDGDWELRPRASYVRAAAAR